MTAAEYAAGLRAFADWLDANQELIDGSHSSGVSLLWDRNPDFWGANAECIAEIARAFGKCEKDYRDDTLTLRRKFGKLTVEASVSRGAVCRKVVKGTRTVPATVIPAQPERIVPEREEEIVEWECSPLLAEKSQP